MPITKLVVDNFMRVRHVELEPTAGVNEITGMNENGKTSLLNAIATMTGGRRPLSWKPISDLEGSSEATIVVHMDGVGEVPIKAIKRFRKTDSGDVVEELILEGPGGARFPKPQNMLNAIVGQFSFDPLAMLRMDADQLRAMLEKFVPDFDFAADRAKAQAEFDERTDVNRRLKEAKAQVAGIMVPSGTPEQPIDESALIAEMQDAGEHNAEIERRRARRSSLTASIVNWDADARQCREQAQLLIARAEGLEKEMSETQSRLDSAGPLPDPIDQSIIRGKIDQARAINVNVSALRQRNALVAKADDLQKESVDLTSALDARKAARADAVNKAKMPLAGLSFDDAGIVLFNGQPFDQASQAVKIRVSIALAAALSPKLKVAIVRDGSLLDRDSFAMIEAFAAEHGLQVFLETVDSSRQGAVVIEDGRVRAPAQIMAAAE